MESSFLPAVGDIGLPGDDLWLKAISGDVGDSSYYIVRFFVINSS